MGSEGEMVPPGMFRHGTPVSCNSHNLVLSFHPFSPTYIMLRARTTTTLVCVR